MLCLFGEGFTRESDYVTAMQLLLEPSARATARQVCTLTPFSYLPVFSYLAVLFTFDHSCCILLLFQRAHEPSPGLNLLTSNGVNKDGTIQPQLAAQIALTDAPDKAVHPMRSAPPRLYVVSLPLLSLSLCLSRSLSQGMCMSTCASFVTAIGAAQGFPLLLRYVVRQLLGGFARYATSELH